MVKAAPLFATILCRWLGKLAMPIGDALSAAAGGILGEIGNDYGERQHQSGRQWRRKFSKNETGTEPEDETGRRGDERGVVCVCV
ncbi:hypothetical protein RRF57_003042 [Xylaria bambusicola]|uniref:Uncharacterized protein n=1 Tax=Xylaria bambusicola TaxID=326684 RepID=A0AAN7UL56_9PEZI